MAKKQKATKSATNVFIDWHDKSLSILVGPEESDLCVKTLRKSGISIGLDKKSDPIYIKINAAENVDKIFKKIAENIEKKLGPSYPEIIQIIEQCSVLVTTIIPKPTSKPPFFETTGEISVVFNIKGK